MRYFLTQFTTQGGDNVVVTHQGNANPTMMETIKWLESKNYLNVRNVEHHEFINKKCFNAFRDGVPYAKEWFKY